MVINVHQNYQKNISYIGKSTVAVCFHIKKNYNKFVVFLDLNIKNNVLLNYQKECDNLLKIYNATNVKGKIKINDYIEFKYGKFDTGIHGFGDVNGGDINNPLQIANYEYQHAENYVEFTKCITNTQNGIAINFMLYNPLTKEDVEERCQEIKSDIDLYDEYCLNEDAILLFTNFVNIKSINPKLTETVFSKHPDTGLYLLKPGATIILSSAFGIPVEETYEVMQSKNIGKQLILTKLDRKI